MNQSKKGKASPKTSRNVTKQQTTVTTFKKPSNAKTGNPKKQFNKPKNQSSNGGRSVADPTTLEYCKSLADPFEFSGPRLGWGCMVPTNVVQAYVRGSTTANADGSVSLMMLPNPSTIVQVANGGLAVSFASSSTNVAAADSTAINANYSVGRIISAGIRAYPNIPMTTAPGAVYCGSVPGLTFAQQQALTTADLAASPYSRQFRSYEGATATIRPEDTYSFAFNTKIVSSTTNFATTDDLPVSNPFVSFVGIGNATVVFYEAVINIECIVASLHSGTALGIGTEWGRRLSDAWSSVERMWTTVKSILPESGTYGAQNSLTKGDTSWVQKAVIGANLAGDLFKYSRASQKLLAV